MLHIEVLDDNTLYIDDNSKSFYYNLEQRDFVVIDLNDGSITISKCARILYPHKEYWKIDVTLHPAYVESRLYMSGGNDVFESAAKASFIVVHRDNRVVLDAAVDELFT